MDNPKVMLEGELLEVSQRDYTAKDGSARSYRSCLFRMEGKVLRFTVSQSGFDAVKAQDGKTAVVILELSTFGNDLEPRLTVVGIGRA